MRWEMRTVVSCVCVFLVTASIATATPPTKTEVQQALDKAISFYHKNASHHGGYVWKYSDDLQYGIGEGVATKDMIWIQPPGTPAVGEAFLEAYRISKNPAHLKAARDVADALVKTQLQSGGWYYHAHFDPAKRNLFSYRDQPKIKLPKAGPGYVGGWDEWRKRRYKKNISLLDDDVTSASLRLLMQVDQVLDFKDKAIREAVDYGLKAVARAQYPVGAWSHNYDRFPIITPDPKHYPVKKASFPENWSRKWDRAFSGCYSINDRITPNVTKLYLLAHQIYKKDSYLETAKRGGQFFILAQMPDPQPSWAQQYNRDMHPVWDRPFEPPAITGFESQDVLETLLQLYRHTGEKRFLEPVPKAIRYMRKSTLPNGKLARFYELKTNRPLYFDKRYQLTYDGSASPDHYGFQFPSRLDDIEREYDRLKKLPNSELAKEPPLRLPKDLSGQVEKIVATMDKRGAWLEPGFVRNLQGRKVVPKAGIISSQTFIDNVHTLCLYLQSDD